MNDTAPKWMGIAAVATLFAIVGAGVALVMFDFELAGAALIGLLIFLLVAVVLMLGWREPAAHAPSGAAHRAGEAPTAAPASAPAPAPAAAPAKAAPAATPAAAAPPAAEAAKVSPSKALGGQSELAGKKGEWAYDSGAKAAPAAAPAPAPEPVVAAEGPGTKPTTLDAPRAGGADNLKEIKGVGPKLEAMLHSMGFYHFDQVASWGPNEVAWVDQNLEGFKGRVTRDNWVAQAKVLAGGGETEFSRKVDKGGVY